MVKDFVLLHERSGINKEDSKGLPLLLRPCLIDYAETFEDGTTALHMEGGKVFNVIENPTEIYSLLIAES